MCARLITLLPLAAMLQMLIGSSAALAQAPPATTPVLPQLSVDLNSLQYPSAAQRAGLQGRVLVAFSITKRGRADELEVVEAEPVGEFDAVAIKAIRQVRFTVPDDWQDSGNVEHRFQMTVLFKISPCVAPACVAPKPHASAADFLVIGAEAK